MAEAKAKKEKKEAAPKEPNINRTNFKELWPVDAKLKVNVAENPKKKGSKSAERFDHYFTSKTVGEFLEKGGTYQDIAYDIARGRIAIG